MNTATSLSRRFLTVSLWLLLMAALPASALAGNRDVLWTILNTCLDPTVADYCSSCRAPLDVAPCAASRGCRDTTQVWVETQEFVALRDRKMCDCTEEFVHGLVLPRTKVTGVEDPKRPEGIWKFAWAIAQSRIPEDAERALAVNPTGKRDQDQLHVHVVRLQKDARRRFAKAPNCQVADLHEVWGTACRLAQAAGYADYGVLVVSDTKGGYLVVVDRASTEKTYTLPRCR
ncbi:hypothetical protein GMST_41910 [Geomonas silvestris]|uniref:CDP-diacylglycerol pyrophosphatase n=1 Tax=Geomonas silvestris TaxID=2740184 RepID=A0A6V8MP80_9BACT|nr:CDP-diacylglycerol diphosphatase [Geomonas silvestris]GFO61866.1 hypothetical protein GMST_41910 [Geomonas silvestris]